MNLILLMKMKTYLNFLVECPMKIIFVRLHKTLDTTFKSGFIGVKQDLKTYEIKPEIGWYLIDGNGDDIFTYKP